MTLNACDDCLRYAQALGFLAPYIEKHSASNNVEKLLTLSRDELINEVAPGVETMIRRTVIDPPPASLTEGCWAVCEHDDRYPEPLRGLPDAPRVLFGRGWSDFLAAPPDDPNVAIVGARRASTYGRETARELGRELAASGVAVVSGLAFGIDACAHRGALDAGRTIAVLPTGVDTCYPAAHRSLWRRTIDKGMVVSELPPETPAWRWSFRARNRIIAGLSAMTVVVEAAQRSGSLITARRAHDYERLVGAVPGPVNARYSSGANDLLAQPETVFVRNAEDVRAALRLPFAREGEDARRIAAGHRIDDLLGEALELDREWGLSVEERLRDLRTEKGANT